MEHPKILARSFGNAQLAMLLVRKCELARETAVKRQRTVGGLRRDYSIEERSKWLR